MVARGVKAFPDDAEIEAAITKLVVSEERREQHHFLHWLEENHGVTMESSGLTFDLLMTLYTPAYAGHEDWCWDCSGADALTFYDEAAGWTVGGFPGEALFPSWLWYA